MSTIGSDLTIVFSILAVIAEVIALVLLLALVFRNSWGRNIILVVGKRAVLFAFVVSLFATVGSLMYSEVAGYEPCKLCWFQRIFMFPQVIILGTALWKKRADVLTYGFVLSSIGICISTYHYLVQRGFLPSPPCAAIGGPSCDKVYTFTFGYITIPVMALSAFALIIAFSLVRFAYNRTQ